MYLIIPRRYLQIFFWLSGFLYGTIKSVVSKYYFNIHRYLFGNSSYAIYAYEEKCRSLKLTNFNKLCKTNENWDKYYLRIIIKDAFENIEKILVFDDKKILLDKITYIEYLVSLEREKFGKYLEIYAINDKISINSDITMEFLKYTSNSGFFQNITQYSLKVSDLYNFDSNSFFVHPEDKLLVTKMNFETNTYNYWDIISLF